MFCSILLQRYMVSPMATALKTNITSLASLVRPFTELLAAPQASGEQRNVYPHTIFTITPEMQC